jgi:hypothetical protein
MSKDKKHSAKVRLVDQAVGVPGAPDGLLGEVALVISDEGYEVADMGGADVYIHGDGRDDCTVWTEVIDGRLMLCVGDSLGENARYLPAIVAYCLCKTDQTLPGE